MNGNTIIGGNKTPRIAVTGFAKAPEERTVGICNAIARGRERGRAGRDGNRNVHPRDTPEREAFDYAI